MRPPDKCGAGTKVIRATLATVIFIETSATTWISSTLGPHSPAAGQRTFTGIKYHRITGGTEANPCTNAGRIERGGPARAAFSRRPGAADHAGRGGARPAAVALPPMTPNCSRHWWYEPRVPRPLRQKGLLRSKRVWLHHAGVVPSLTPDSPGRHTGRVKLGRERLLEHVAQ